MPNIDFRPIEVQIFTASRISDNITASISQRPNQNEALLEPTTALGIGLRYIGSPEPDGLIFFFASRI